MHLSAIALVSKKEPRKPVISFEKIRGLLRASTDLFGKPQDSVKQSSEILKNSNEFLIKCFGYLEPVEENPRVSSAPSCGIMGAGKHCKG